MIVDLRRQHQFVRIGLLYQRFQSPLDGVQSTNDGISQRCSTPARSIGDQYSSMSSPGGGNGPGVPRRRLMNCCCSDVKRPRLDIGIGGEDTPTMT